MIELRTLGALELTDADGTPIGSVLAQPRRTALLCYIALASPRGFQRRDTLFALFWPEHDAEQARHSLRQSLYFLRRALGANAIISRNDEELALAPDQVRCDAWDFERAADEKRLEAALTLYRGDLLAGFNISDAPEFERWLDDERARLRRRAAQVMWSLAETRERDGDSAGAAECARQAAAFAPGDETVLRRLLLLLQRVGDTGTAVRAYDAFAKNLMKEYELEPSEETRALLARIRAEREPTGHALSPPRPRPEPDGLEAILDVAAQAGAVDRPPSQLIPSHLARPWWTRTGVWFTTAALLALVITLTSGIMRRVWSDTGASMRERVMVADFTDLTDDTAYGDLVGSFLRNELARSPLLSVAGRETITGALQRMRLGSDVRVRGDVAREIAVREEIKVVVDGDVRGVGTSLAVTASVIEAATGEIIHGASETARDPSQLLAAIKRLSNAIRRGIGESLASVDSGVPLWSFTTGSLPALRKQMAGIRARRRGEYLRAAQLVQEAIALDSSFAHAYVSLAAQRHSAGLPSGQLAPSIARMYALRDRLTPRERTAIEGHYHLNVTGDFPLAFDAFRKHVEELQQIGESGWWSAYVDLLERSGNLRRQDHVLDEVLALTHSSPHYVNLRARTHYALGQLAEARQLLMQSARSKHPAVLRLLVGWLADSARYEEAHEVAARIPRETGLHNDLKAQAELDAMRGRLAEAVTHLRQLRDQALALGELAPALEIAAAIGRLRLLAGDSAGASEVDDLLEQHPVDSIHVLARPYLPLVLFYAKTGQAARAKKWLSDYERQVPAEFQGPDLWMLHRARAALYRTAGKLVQALAELKLATHIPPMRAGLFDPPSIRTNDHPELARVYADLGSPDSAIAVYERYLAVRSLSRISIDAFELGEALDHLSYLYAQRGENLRATEHYRRLARLWRGADPALAPRLHIARMRATP